MRRLPIIGGIVIVLAMIWLYAGHVATQRARRTVDDLIARAGLSSAVTYDDVTASPFGTVRLSHVSITTAGVPPTEIGRLVLSGIRRDEDGLQAIDIDAREVSAPLLELARHAGVSGGGLAVGVRDMLATGMTILHGRIQLSYSYDPSDRDLTMGATIRIRQVGGGTMSARLVDVEPLWMQTIAQLGSAQLGSPSMDGGGAAGIIGALQGLTTLRPMRLKALSWSIDDGPLVGRLGQVPAQSMPVHESVDTTSADEMQMTRMLRDGGLPLRDARDDAHLLTAWQQKGGTLSFETNLTSPLALTAPGGMFGIVPAFDTPEAFVARSHGTFDD